MKDLNSYKLGTHSFLLGSIMFTLDAIKHKNRLTFAGCMLFNIGCVFFEIDAYRN
jgi:hypothetical protein